jgi:nicotinamidase-related amidase
MATYDTETALLVADVQNDFADPGGSLYVQGGEEVVPVINREIGRALEAGAKVFNTQDWHPESTPHFEKDGGHLAGALRGGDRGGGPASRSSDRRRDRAQGN